MLLTRYAPFGGSWFQQMQQLQNEMNRLFGRWTDAEADYAGYPALNVSEAEDEFVVEAELPGLDLKDIEIYVTGRTQLTIKGERQPPAPQKSVQHRQERGFGKFGRTLSLPAPVDENKVEARLENGVLTIRLPKHEAAKPRRIPVKG